MQTTVVEHEWKPHPKQYEIFNSTARFKFSSCGRRFGKNVVAWNYLLKEAMTHSNHLYWWVAPINKELIPASQTIKAFTPPEFIKRKYERQNIITFIELYNGTEIYFHSANTEDSLRGSGLNGIVIDEAGSFPGARWEEELLPSLMDHGGWLLAIGTPKGRNWFYDGYLRGQDRESFPNYESWQYSSYENSTDRGGYIARENIDSIAETLPEITRRQEIFAEFLEDAGLVFRPQYGGELRVAKPFEKFHLGADLAKTEDWTVLTALDGSGQLVGFDRFKELNWEDQKHKITTFMARYPGKMLMDSSGLGDPIYDALSRQGLPVKGYKFTSESKRNLVENLGLCFDEARVRVPRDLPAPHGKVLANELEAYTYKILPTGNIRYGAPEGLHDDCPTSLMLAAWSLYKQGNIFIIA